MKKSNLAKAVVYGFLLLMTMTSCKNIAKFMNNVVEHNYVENGVKLAYEGETVLDVPYTDTELYIDSDVAKISLQGGPDAPLRLKLCYQEYKPRDATFMIENRKITYYTKSGKPASLKEVIGNVPNSLALNIDVGTGNVEVQKMKDSPKISVNCGTASVDIQNCSLDMLEANTGTGNINVTSCTINTATLETGTGNINLKSTQIEKRNFSTGTGGVNEE
ncbi:MAG: DUF4097 family beta strand repeat-containing protein [Candidatus Cloacimonas sp.]|nr:DUF4097 family beta strand repeat-containing protein [Candidatus Cloacimonas sp.]